MALTHKQRTTIVYFAEILIPDLKDNPDESRNFLEHFISYFKLQDLKIQKQLGLLILVINYLCVIFKGRTFNSCSDIQKESYVKRLFYFPIPKLINGVTGLRTLCLFTYYGHADQWKKLKYDGPIKR